MLPPSRWDKNTLKYVKTEVKTTQCSHYVLIIRDGYNAIEIERINRFVNMYDRRLKPPASERTTENKASEAGRPTLQSAAAHHDNGNPQLYRNKRKQLHKKCRKLTPNT